MPQYLSTDPNAGTPIEAPQASQNVDTSWSGSHALAALGRAAEGSPAHAKAVRENMPMVGGLVGSTLGGPIGAAAGGAAGKVLQDVTGGQMPTVGGTALEGGKQLAYDAGGKIVGGGLKLLGRGVYGAGAMMLPKSIKQEFPTIAAAGYRENIPLTGRGADTAGARAGEVSQRLKAKLSMMDRAGAKPIDPNTEVAPALNRTRGEVAHQPLRAADNAAINDFEAQFLKENPTPMSLATSHEMKRGAQKLATQGYRQMERGAPIQSLPLDLNMDVARGLREAIESRVPSAAKENQRIQDLMGLEVGGNHASLTAHVVPRALGATALGVSGGWVPALAGMAATTPQGLSLTGLGLKGLGTAASHPVTPQAIRLAALLEALAGQ